MSCDPWQFVERLSVRKLGSQGFICEARFHGFFEHGEICDDPTDAMRSAARALDATVRPKMNRPSAMFSDLL